MRRRDVLALLAAAAAPWPRPARAGTAELDEAVGFAGQILFLSAKVPALIIGVVRNGQTSIHGFGRREDSANAEPDGKTLFRIGSVTKAFTGQVLASLAAEGKVSLADPLTKYVPDFVAPLSEGGRPIRLIDLATHSAGLPREVPHAPGPPDDPFANITREAFVSWLKANPLLFTPGTAILYSNFGFDLLAAALSAAAKKTYPDLVAERVLNPLGLDDTTFAPSGDQPARLMQGHDFDGAPMPAATTGTVIVGSGGLYSTASDLLRWLEWHLDRLGAERAAERLIDHAAYLWRDGLNAVIGMDESGPMEAIGLGWVVMRPEGDRPLILQKAGGLQGIFSYVAFAPMRDIGVIAAINAFDVNAGLAMAKAANDLIAELAPR
ncbi:MAG TPA: D-alanyl-D-alanine-carboxypeptidase/endopeptidase AmpH [Roseiarcus sp.]|jgi:D-alanyl-D-alanine-carboxypeptidase/D-alanyl-D-alanine-endopeptidase|nr:D-alanyl-D-alanine-carboxypeptidase/endopeptidase AmpH [Roseiarcus sp.]